MIRRLVTQKHPAIVHLEARLRVVEAIAAAALLLSLAAVAALEVLVLR